MSPAPPRAVFSSWDPGDRPGPFQREMLPSPAWPSRPPGQKAAERREHPGGRDAQSETSTHSRNLEFQLMFLLLHMVSNHRDHSAGPQGQKEANQVTDTAWGSPCLCHSRGRPRGHGEQEASGDTEAAATAPSPCTEAEWTAGRRRGTHGLPGSSGGRGRLRAPGLPGRRTSRPSSK